MVLFPAICTAHSENRKLIAKAQDPNGPNTDPPDQTKWATTLKSPRQHILTHTDVRGTNRAHMLKPTTVGGT